MELFVNQLFYDLCFTLYIGPRHLKDDHIQVEIQNEILG